MGCFVTVRFVFTHRMQVLLSTAALWHPVRLSINAENSLYECISMLGLVYRRCGGS